jgi:hypothetical protein
MSSSYYIEPLFLNIPYISKKLGFYFKVYNKMIKGIGSPSTVSLCFYKFIVRKSFFCIDFKVIGGLCSKLGVYMFLF